MATTNKRKARASSKVKPSVEAVLLSPPTRHCSILQERRNPPSFPIQMVFLGPLQCAQRPRRWQWSDPLHRLPRMNRLRGQASRPDQWRVVRRMPLWWLGAPSHNSKVSCSSPKQIVLLHPKLLPHLRQISDACLLETCRGL
jgi:hypothetical protein